MRRNRFHPYLRFAVAGLALLLAFVLLGDGLTTPPLLAQEETPDANWQPKPSLPERPPSKYGLAYSPIDWSHLGSGTMPEGMDASALPAQFDWRTQTNAKGQPIVTASQSQGGLGTCWAFGAVGQMESKLSLRNFGVFDLSEQSTANCPTESRGGGDACQGGDESYAYNWWAQAGTHTEAQNAYSDDTCGSCPTKKPFGYAVTGWTKLVGNEVPKADVLKAYLMKYGPLSVAIKADNQNETGQNFMEYDGSEPLYMPIGQGEGVDHAVLLVGWDDEKKHAGGNGVWLVKNSWGPEWGIDGFFEIAYGSANFGMQSSAITGVEPVDPKGELLYQDRYAFSQPTGGGSKAAWGMVEVKPTKGNVCAAQVELFTSDIVQDLDVYLYDDLVSGKPQTLLAQVLDQKADAGYAAVKFNNQVKVSAGNQLYVVVRIQNKTQAYPLSIDTGTKPTAGNWVSTDGKSWKKQANPLSIRLRTKTCGAAPPPTPTATPTQVPPTPTPTPTLPPATPTTVPVAAVCLNTMAASAGGAGGGAAEPPPPVSDGVADPNNRLGTAIEQLRPSQRPDALEAAARAMQRTTAQHSLLSAPAVMQSEPTPTPGFGLDPAPTPAPSVYGVVTVGGAPAKEATVWIYPLDDDGNPVDTGITGIVVNDDGSFALFLAEGSYYLDFEPAESNGYVTLRKTVKIDSPTTSLDLGEVVIPEGDKELSGFVHRDGNLAAPMPDVMVYAYNSVTDQLVSTYTDAQGAYLLKVGEGAWEAAVFPDGVGDWVYADPFKVVTIGAADPAARLDFSVVTAAGYVTGRILAPDGQPLPPEKDYGNGINYYVSMDLWDEQKEVYTFSYVDLAGNYAVPVIPGEYSTEVWIGGDVMPLYFASPRLAPTAYAGRDIDLGTVNVLDRSVTISGRIMRADGSPAEEIFVDIWQPDGAWQWTYTDEDGYYEDYVPAGKWLVAPFVPGFVSQMYTGDTASIDAADGQNVTQDFQLEDASGWLNGSVVDEAGALLADVEAFAYLRRADQSAPIGLTPVRYGRFQIKAPIGPVQAGLYLAPNTPYSALATGAVAQGDYAGLSTSAAAIADMVQYEHQGFAGAQLQTDLAPFVLRRDDAALAGRLVDGAGAAMTGVNGRVLLIPSGGGSVGKESRIDPSTGAFAASLGSGRWQLTYELETDLYQRAPLEPLLIEVAAGQTAAPALQPVLLDGVISGQVLDPDDKPVPLAAVRIVGIGAAGCSSEACRPEYLVRAGLDGKFIAYVPLAAGQLYDVYASTRACAAGAALDQCLVNAEKSSAPAAARTSLDMVASGTADFALRLVMRKADYLLIGQAVDDTGAPLPYAWVDGYSPDRQFIGVETDENGCFQAPTKRTGVFHLRVMYVDWDTWEMYSGSGSYTLNALQSSSSLEVLNGALVAQKRGRVPKPVLTKAETAHSAGYTMEDGAQVSIPANSMPTEDRAANLAMQPAVDLPADDRYQPLGYGYNVGLYEDGTGKKLEQDLRSAAQITLRYREDAGKPVDTLKLRPAVRNGDSWEVATDYVVDAATKKVMVTTRRLGKWALVVVDDRTAQTGGSLYLPFIDR